MQRRLRLGCFTSLRAAVTRVLEIEAVEAISRSPAVESREWYSEKRKGKPCYDSAIPYLRARPSFLVFRLVRLQRTAHSYAVSNAFNVSYKGKPDRQHQKFWTILPGISEATSSQHVSSTRSWKSPCEERREKRRCKGGKGRIQKFRPMDNRTSLPVSTQEEHAPSEKMKPFHERSA